MGTVNRWLKYAKAKLDATVKSGNEEMDRLEAQREAEAADRPWLEADGESPTLEEARARIRWEEEDAARRAKGDPTFTTAAGRPSNDPAAPDTRTPTSRGPSAPTPATDEPAAKAPTATTADNDEAQTGNPAATTAGKDQAPAKDPAAPAVGGDAEQASREPPSPAGPPAPQTDPLLDAILPSTPEEAAARSNARIELERREREAAARLEEIRRELGVDPPSPPAGPDGAGSG